MSGPGHATVPDESETDGASTATTALRSFWARFWFAEVDGLPLALVRIAFAVASLWSWVAIVRGLRLHYSDLGSFSIEFARVWGSEWVGRFLMPDWLGGLPAAAVMAGLYGAALLALLVGWRTRAAVVLTWLLTLWFHHRNPSFLSAGHGVLRLTSLYLACAFLFIRPADRALSVDRARTIANTGGSLLGPTFVPAWSIRLIQIQVVILYAVSGFWKLTDDAWRNGTALWIAVANPAFSRFGPPRWAPRVLFAAGTLLVSLWELLFPVLVSLRRTRLVALGIGMGLHLFILTFMNTGVFPLAMLALYPAFLRPGEIRALVRKVTVDRPIASRVGG